VRLSVEGHDTPFTQGIPEGMTLRMPIAHGEGSYYLPANELDALESSGQVAFRYAAPEGNPNGSLRDIAGVTDATGRICGLMPHPERASESLLGSDDGLFLLRSMVESAARVEAAA
jgi:phosphoribosylformylglycinamidine synthase subunit PurQ / glutaminase